MLDLHPRKGIENNGDTIGWCVEIMDQPRPNRIRHGDRVAGAL
jgi:hypothetical protein